MPTNTQTWPCTKNSITWARWTASCRSNMPPFSTLSRFFWNFQNFYQIISNQNPSKRRVNRFAERFWCDRTRNGASGWEAARLLPGQVDAGIVACGKKWSLFSKETAKRINLTHSKIMKKSRYQSRICWSSLVITVLVNKQKYIMWHNLCLHFNSHAKNQIGSHYLIVLIPL